MCVFNHTLLHLLCLDISIYTEASFLYTNLIRHMYTNICRNMHRYTQTHVLFTLNQVFHYILIFKSHTAGSWPFIFIYYDTLCLLIYMHRYLHLLCFMCNFNHNVYFLVFYFCLFSYYLYYIFSGVLFYHYLVIGWLMSYYLIVSQVFNFFSMRFNDTMLVYTVWDPFWLLYWIFGLFLFWLIIQSWKALFCYLLQWSDIQLRKIILSASPFSCHCSSHHLNFSVRILL